MTHVTLILDLMENVTDVILVGQVFTVICVTMDGMVQIVIHVMPILDLMACATHAILGGLVLTVTCATETLDPRGHVIPV